MMNEVEKHLRTFLAQDPVPCPHPQCQEVRLILPTVMAFKAHTATVHQIFLRDSSVLNQVNDNCILELATISGTPEGPRERTGLRAVGVEFGLSSF